MIEINFYQNNLLFYARKFYNQVFQNEINISVSTLIQLMSPVEMMFKHQ